MASLQRFLIMKIKVFAEIAVLFLAKTKPTDLLKMLGQDKSVVAVVVFHFVLNN